MSLKLIPPSTSRQSKTKFCALCAFRVIRSIQAKAAQIPYMLLQVRDDVITAWRESADTLPNA